jgi:uncharacterized protein YbjT (DUF2867 family)
MNVPDLVGPAAIGALRGKRILLAGASGNNGAAVLQQLVTLGFAVRALSRQSGRPAAHGATAPGEVDWVQGDVTQPGTLGRILDGIDVVISAVAGKPFGGPSPEVVDYQGTANLAAAARVAGVHRFVIITSSGSGRQGGLINFIGRNVLVWKGKAEEALRGSGLEYVIVGPARLTDGPGGTQRIRLIPRDQYDRAMTLTRADLASVVIGAAGLPGAANRAFSAINVAGPADDAWREDFARLPSA